MLAAAVLAVVVAQTTLGRGPDSSQQDPITTLALVLAILAFMVQIFVYAFQTNAAYAAARRSEQLDARSRRVLDKIKTTARVSHELQAAQFDRLLDYVVGPGGAAAANEEGEQIEAATLGRPRFAGISTPSVEDLRIVEFLRSWPEIDRAKQSVATIVSLSPYSVARLKKYVDNEAKQRLRGASVALRGLENDRDRVGESQEELLREGLIANVEPERTVLTEEGREVGRLLAGGKHLPVPGGLIPVLKPLSSRRVSSG